MAQQFDNEDLEELESFQEFLDYFQAFASDFAASMDKLNRSISALRLDLEAFTQAFNSAKN